MSDSFNATSSSPRLGLVSLVCLVIGNMIGVGVYVSAGYALADLKNAKYVLMVWVIAGLHALCGAVAYAAVARRLNVSGGEYSILSRWAHPSLGFVAGWVSIVAGFAAPIAATAKLLADYALNTNAKDSSAVFQSQLLATTIVLIAAVLHWVEVRWNAWVNNIVIFIKFVGLSIFLILGAKWILGGHGGTGLLETAPDTSAPSNWALLIAALGSFYFTTLSYTGFNASIYIVGEYQSQSDGDDRGKQSYFSNPVAASMVLACGIVTIIYLALNTVFMYAIPADQMVKAGEQFVGEVARGIGGESFGTIMKWIIILSTSTSVLAMMITGPYVYVQLGRDLGWGNWVTNPRSQIRISIILQTVLSVSILWLSTLRETISFLGLTLTACGGLAIASLWVAQWRRHFLDRLRIQWWEHLCAAIYVLGAAALLGLALMLDRERNKFWWCLETFSIGLLVYMLFGQRRISSNGDARLKSTPSRPLVGALTVFTIAICEIMRYQATKDEATRLSSVTVALICLGSIAVGGFLGFVRQRLNSSSRRHANSESLS